MSGERILLDSTFIAGLINSRDQLHLQAKNFLLLVENAAEVVITEAVLIEVGNLLHSVQHRQRAAQFIDACYETTNVTIVSVDTELLRNAVDFYRLHQDKDWGLTDCLSFIVMKERGLIIAMTADATYPTGGFSRADARTANLTPTPFFRSKSS
jgi:predicted nucleic acid-binding protein